MHGYLRDQQGSCCRKQLRIETVQKTALFAALASSLSIVEDEVGSDDKSDEMDRKSQQIAVIKIDDQIRIGSALIRFVIQGTGGCPQLPSSQVSPG